MKDQKFKFSLTPVTLETAKGQQKPLLEQSLQDSGMIPNMYANMVNSPGLMDTYAIGYTHFRKESGFSPAEQEVVFVTLSVANGCEYCVAAHSFLADKVSKVPEEVTNAIRDGREIPDAKLKVLSEFTRVIFDTHGNPSVDDVQKFTAAGYPEKQILEIILATAVKTLSNYSNHIFQTPVDEVFSGREWIKRN